MNKTIRNNALREVSRLITGEYNGQEWYCPDGYIATTEPIYEGYKIKKNQTIPDQKPKLDVIFERIKDRKYYKTTNQPDNGNTLLLNSVNTELIDSRYFELMQTLGADNYEISDRHLDPVKVYKNNQLIGLVMPLRS